jgi:hypothetical protein
MKGHNTMAFEHPQNHSRQDAIRFASIHYLGFSVIVAVSIFLFAEGYRFNLQWHNVEEFTAPGNPVDAQAIPFHMVDSGSHERANITLEYNQAPEALYPLLDHYLQNQGWQTHDNDTYRIGYYRMYGQAASSWIFGTKRYTLTFFAQPHGRNMSTVYIEIFRR